MLSRLKLMLLILFNKQSLYFYLVRDKAEFGQPGSIIHMHGAVR